MKVLILCGGQGTRMREETEYRPKPMVEIGGRPMLWHIMRLYAHYGYNDFVLCLGYKSRFIKDYFLNYQVMRQDFTVQLGAKPEVEVHRVHDVEDWKVTLADTGDSTLKGGRIKRVERYVKDDDLFMLTYGDGIADVNIDKLVAFHRSHGKMVTVTGVRPPSLFGELQVEGDMVRCFSEKPQTSEGLINGGFFVCSREVMDRLSADEDCDFEFGPLEKIAEEQQLMVYRHDGDWVCMDTTRDVAHLNKIWDQGRAFWKAWA